MIYTNTPKEIGNKIEEDLNISGLKNWKWQLKHSIRSFDKFEYLTGINFCDKQKEELEYPIDKLPLSINPDYLSLIDRKNYVNYPVFKQAFGGGEDLITLNSELKDLLSEENDSPVKGITHRYPDRALFHVSNICYMYCRHCTRRRKVSDVDFVSTKDQLKGGINYITETPQTRDVLLSGGDPLILSDEKLDWLLS